LFTSFVQRGISASILTAEKRCHFIKNLIREKGITSSQFSVLDVLYTKGEMRICELIEKVLSTSGNMTVVVKNMEQKGWLYRKSCPKDKRAFLVGLTDEGKKLFENLLPEHRKEIEETYGILSDEERRELIRILKKFKDI